MNFKKCLFASSAFFLAACTSPIQETVDTSEFNNLLLGSWKCGSIDEYFKEDTVLVYSKDGQVSVDTSMYMKVEGTDDVLSFDISGTASWELNKDNLYEVYEEINFKPTNEYTASIKGFMSSLMPKKGQRGKSKVLSLDNNKLILESGDNEKLTCYRK
ncbi:hypothetical protein [Vibrio bivalvicida]|uniref:Lipocalin-like domain-containing protein n=1 Tax=Vibrio bivalvicida TaxID=1276888 RepID=A0A177Y315_9VIBR|nr:hypothetical protein [Vibrio bivalvicida]OAJ95230.1 hypothetical protein APB76_08080 [Vibrio bivalvicida]